MQSTERSTRLFIPALAGFYEWVKPYCYPLMRFAVGAIIISHGWIKLMAGEGAIAAQMAKQGFLLPGLVAVLIMTIETVGGFCVAIGLLTRFWAAAMAIELAVIAFDVQWHNGYGRVEGLLLWGVFAFAIALRGGGRCSVDRMIGWEL
jgi:putative oxidoreductase